MRRRLIGRVPKGSGSWTAVFSPRGDRAALIAAGSVRLHVRSKNGALREEPQPTYPEITEFAFGPDGKRFAYRAVDTRRGRHVVVDGVEGPPDAGIASPVFLADGRVAYHADQGKGGVLVVGEERRPVPWGSKHRVHGLRLTPDGRSHAFVIVEGRRWFVVHDQEKHGPYAYAGELFLAPSNRLAFVAMEKPPQFAEAFVVHDGVRGPVAQGITQPVLSPDGHRLLYGAKIEGQFRLVENHEIQPLAAAWIGGLAIDARGQRIAAVLQRGAKRALWVDGIEGPPMSSIAHVVFSPRGTHVACRCDDRGLRVALDRQRSTPFAHLDRPFFTAEHTVGFGAVHRNEILWVEMDAT